MHKVCEEIQNTIKDKMSCKIEGRKFTIKTYYSTHEFGQLVHRLVQNIPDIEIKDWSVINASSGGQRDSNRLSFSLPDRDCAQDLYRITRNIEAQGKATVLAWKGRYLLDEDKNALMHRLLSDMRMSPQKFTDYVDVRTKANEEEIRKAGERRGAQWRSGWR